MIEGVTRDARDRPLLREPARGAGHGSRDLRPARRRRHHDRDLRDWLRDRGGAWETALGTGRNVRAAVDQRMARDDAALVDGAEIAFFPPVTGG